MVSSQSYITSPTTDNYTLLLRYAFENASQNCSKPRYLQLYSSKWSSFHFQSSNSMQGIASCTQWLNCKPKTQMHTVTKMQLKLSFRLICRGPQTTILSWITCIDDNLILLIIAIRLTDITPTTNKNQQQTRTINEHLKQALMQHN